MASKEFDEGDKMRRFKTNLANPGAALKQIGAFMVSESQRSFKLQKFGKTGWRERAPINVFGIISDFHAGKKAPPNRRFDTRPALRDTGRLAQSIAFKVSGDTVTVGSNLPYAGVHQHGGPVESLPITQAVQTALGKWLQGKGSELQEKLGPLLSPSKTGKTLKMEVPARPFVGVTKQTEADILEAIGVKIFEVK